LRQPEGESDPAAEGFVLAGGRSSRMGSDKAVVELDGRMLIERAIAILETAGIPVRIAGAHDESRPHLESFAPVIPDSERGLGPLAGVCAALRSTPAEYAVFLPVDVPFMPSSLVEYLLRHARITASAVTLASINAFWQTFPAVISRRTLPILEKRLRNRELGCLSAFRTAGGELGQTVSVLPVEILVQSGQVAHPQALPPARWFLNVNSAADLRLAWSLRTGRVS
jgi:molybdopterin-guanine dinucleotide biosynthesis protein A